MFQDGEESTRRKAGVGSWVVILGRSESMNDGVCTGTSRRPMLQCPNCRRKGRKCGRRVTHGLHHGALKTMFRH